ncbi:RNase HII [Prochlorococcus marinus str. MIT 9312]|uniref:Ribonuclease HII n=1 Tax=Prochlorococcus marinus (strain MIT 9312) TaxID=74546 RepID=RNH2_PROM9|nr:ribonuclease HII [Prochlorococcus marinus]Q318P1.1 RecName: Full=Ribonuclease HII; Short=RNase HII [Prochlorococcus marinus str. MIT 9312]ABB50654.1 RNase HII [Prochlorococcus marinus str. MIT 9312]KGF98765.1 Ribonuclease HII [Prochlorococcus marinus str. MIT 9311]
MREKKEEDLQQVLNKVSEVGIDEVGRGAVFGPVFSAVVVLTEKNKFILKQFGVKDSKKLTPKKRKLLLPKILLLSSDYGIGQSSAREIDMLGIRVATELSMIRALKKLKEKPSEIIVDGPLLLRPWKGIQKNIVSGDSKITAIASASIVAKVARDNLMERLEKKYSGYLIFKNKGYGTREHFSNIKKNGITNLHRKSFLNQSDLI